MPQLRPSSCPPARSPSRARAALRVLVLAGLVGLAPACADEGGAEAVYQQLKDDNYRANYRRAPGWEDARQPKDGGPHGAFIDIYVNDVMAAAIDANAEISAWPEGSMIVKDGWASVDASAPKYLVVMERRADGWFWIEWEGDGDKLVVARDDAVQCVGCHSAGEDQVRAFGLPPL